MLPNVHFEKAFRKTFFFIILQNIYDALASLRQSYVDFVWPEYFWNPTNRRLNTYIKAIQSNEFVGVNAHHEQMVTHVTV